MDVLTTAGKQTIRTYFESHGLTSSCGYTVGGGKSPKVPAPHLHGLPKFFSTTKRSHDGYLMSSSTPRIRVDDTYDIFIILELVTESRRAEAFHAPLVIFPQAPRHDLGIARAFFSDTAVAYDNSFYGFSTQGHGEADDLARYLSIILNSRITLYYLLMLSSMMGAQVKRFELHEVRSVAFPAWEDLSEETRAESRKLSETVFTSTRLPNEEIDRFVGRLFGLSDPDLQVIYDTLSVSLPFRASVNNAQRRPTHKDIEAFREVVVSVMDPILSHASRSAALEEMPRPNTTPWLWFRVRVWSLEAALTNESATISAEHSGGGGETRLRERREPCRALGRHTGRASHRDLCTVPILHAYASSPFGPRSFGDPKYETWLRGGTL